MDMMDSGMQPGLLGKMPAHGDFVRANATGTLWRLFDGWIQEGTYLAQQKNRLSHDFADAPGYGFLFTPANESHALVGYLKPSRDQIGRKYPLILARTIEKPGTDAASLRRLPVLHERFLSDARVLIDRAARGAIDRQSILTQLEQMSGSIDQQQADAAYYSYLSETSWRELCADIWGQFDAASKYLVFKNLADLLTPLRAGVPPQYTLGFRFPGGTDKTVHGNTMSFWLDLIFRSLRHSEVTPSLFWRLPAEGKRSISSLLAFFRSPTSRVFSEMVPDEIESDHICDLDKIGAHKVAEARSHLPASLGEILDNPESTLMELRDLVG